MYLPSPIRLPRFVSVWRFAALLLLLATTAAHASVPPSLWPQRLQASLELIDRNTPGDIGVYVLDLDSGLAVSHRAEESWYLASMVKIPVALAVMRGVERGDFSLETRVTLQSTDYVDGAGQTNGHAAGSPLRVRWLLEQMIIYSDNTATDMLIGLVGLDAVNGMTQSLVGFGLEPITTLADVRRELYGRLTPAALDLSGKDFLVIRRQPSDAERVQALGGIVGAPAGGFGKTLGQAYDEYYATGLNSGRLDAFGGVLALLAQGQVLTPASTSVLLDIMQRVRTGDRRLKAGFPASVSFAHKTGTQRARFCDAGIAGVPATAGARRVVVVACTRSDASSARSERALRDVGEAVRQSGLMP